MDLDALEVLEAIVETGTFSRAAGRLHRTQSAISYAVARLETALGVSLFDRSGHRAMLTPAGQAILDEGRAVLHRARRLETVARQLQEGWEPRLVVVIDGILPIAPVLDALARFVAEDVPTRVQVTMAFRRGVQERFEADRADIMVVKDFTPGPGLRSLALAPVDLVLVCGAAHPLARLDRVERPALQEHVELSVRDAGPTAGLDASIFGGARVFFLSDFHAKRAALRAGLGFGWMPLGLVQADLAAGALAELPFVEGSRGRFTPMIVHRSDRPLGRAGRMVLERLQEALT